MTHWSRPASESAFSLPADPAPPPLHAGAPGKSLPRPFLPASPRRGAGMVIGTDLQTPGKAAENRDSPLCAKRCHGCSGIRAPSVSNCRAGAHRGVPVRRDYLPGKTKRNRTRRVFQDCFAKFEWRAISSANGLRNAGNLPAWKSRFTNEVS